ncbi:MAG: class A beta-lactamase [Pyrinomonadaceae bacterium]
MIKGICKRQHALAVILVSVFLTGSCTYFRRPGQGLSGDAASITPTPELTAPPRPNEKPDHALEAELRRIADLVKGKVGVGAVLLETGESAWLERSTHFPSQSVYKLPIAMAVMKMLDEGRVRIDQDVTINPNDYVRRGFHSPIRNLNPGGTIMPLSEIVRYSISESDGSASDILLDLAGGPPAVQSYLESIGINDFIVADSEKSISKDWETQYRNYATPDASIDLLGRLVDGHAGLSTLTKGILLQAMTDSDTGGRRIKRGLPAGSSLAHKTGTGGRPSESPGGMKAAFENSNSSGNFNANSNRRSKAELKKAAKYLADAHEQDQITSATNDIGIITLPDGRHILLAVFVMDSSSDAWTRERAIADIAKAVCEKWTTGTVSPGVLGDEKTTR